MSDCHSGAALLSCRHILFTIFLFPAWSSFPPTLQNSSSHFSEAYASLSYLVSATSSPPLLSIGVSLDPFAASFHPFPITFSSSANSCHLYWYSIHSGFKIHLGCFCFIIAMIWITVGVVFHRSHWVPQKSLPCHLSSFPSSLVSNAPESFSKKWDCTLRGSCLLSISLIVQVTLVFFLSFGPTTL